MVKKILDRKFDLEDRLVQFAVDCAQLCGQIATARKLVNEYYANQLLRSAGSAALNYGETQGTFTSKDYVNKASICLKELKESRVNLKIMGKLELAALDKAVGLETECEELIAIVATLIKNKSQKSISEN